MFRFIKPKSPILLSFIVLPSLFGDKQVLHAQVIQPETISKVRVLFENNPAGSSFGIVNYYLTGLIEDIKDDLQTSSDSVAKAYLIDSIVVNKLGYRVLGDQLRRQFNGLITKQQDFYWKFRVKYGDILRAQEIKNGELRPSVSQFKQLYEYANRQMLDTIA